MLTTIRRYSRRAALVTGSAMTLVLLATGVANASFLGNEGWTDGGYYGSRGTYFTDVTGDGRADAVVVNDDGVYVRPSTGNAFTNDRTLGAGPWISGGYYGSRGTYFTDVTGDGRADAVVVNDYGINVEPSNGSSFARYSAQAGPWTAGAYYGSRGTYFADVTGDRRADAIVVNDYGVTVRRAA